MPDSATLRIHNGQLVVVGDGVINTTITIKLAQALMRLPPMTTDGSLSISDVMRRMDASTKRSFETIVKLDKQLGDQYAKLKDSFAAIANPAKPKWTLKFEDMVEELIVDCAPVMVIIFTTDGERFVSPAPKDYSKLFTFEEFETTYGRSVPDHVRYVATTRISALKRALELIETDHPCEYSLDVCTDDMAMVTRKVKVFSEDQIHLFAQRHKVSIMNATPILKD